MNSECTFTHLKFTKRYREKSENTTNSQRSEHHPSPWSNPDISANQINLHQNSNQPKSQNQEAPQSGLAFLAELIQSMKQDMMNVQTEVREFKTNISAQVHQYQSQSQMMPPPQQTQVDQTAATNQMQQCQQNLAMHPEQTSQLQYSHPVMLLPSWNPKRPGQT